VRGMVAHITPLSHPYLSRGQPHLKGTRFVMRGCPLAKIGRTVREIEEEAQSAGALAQAAAGTSPALHLPPGAEEPGRTITVGVSPSLAWKWDTARELFHRLEGADCAPGAFVEALLAEFLSGALTGHADNTTSARPTPSGAAHPDTPSPMGSPSTPGSALSPGAPWAGSGGTTVHSWREEWQEVHRSLEELSNRWEFLSRDPVHVRVTVAEAHGAPGRELACQCREITRLGQEVVFSIARLLRTVSQLSLYRDMMFSSLGHYAVERLGMSRRTAYELVWLGRRFIELPELGEAFRGGGLTREQAMLIASIAGEKTVEAWIAWARVKEMRALRDEVARIRRLVEMDENLSFKVLLVPGYGAQRPGEEGGGHEAPQGGVRMCAAGAAGERESAAGEHMGGKEPFTEDRSRGALQITFRLQASLEPMWIEALARFRASLGAGRVHGGGHDTGANREERAEENVLSCFLEILVDHFLDTWLTLTKKERHHRVLHRDGFRCTIPGCSSRRNLQVHHVIFRSHGGNDEDSNEVTLCMAHHLAGVHGGHITITGQAPDRLTVELGVERGKEPFAVWTCGERVVHS